tara:strand:- start:2102 stop:2563 length:462 start_codon:yes stop_codon:yes gene_type:complete
MNWVTSSFLNILFGSLFIVLYSYIAKKYYKNMSVPNIMLNIYIWCGILGLIYFAKMGNPMLKEKNSIRDIIILGTIYLITMILFIQAFRTAPNPSYSVAISNVKVALILIVTLIIYKQRMNKPVVLGMGFVLIGVYLIIHYGNKQKNNNYIDL